MYTVEKLPGDLELSMMVGKDEMIECGVWISDVAEQREEGETLTETIRRIEPDRRQAERCIFSNKVLTQYLPSMDITINDVSMITVWEAKRGGITYSHVIPTYDNPSLNN